MAVSTTNAVSGPYVANGSTTAFPFTFKCLTIGEVRVSLTVATVETDVDPADYTVTLNTLGNGGTVTFDAPPATGDVRVYSDPEFTQETGFASGQAFSPSVVNEALDRAAVRDQYILRKVNAVLDSFDAGIIGDIRSDLISAAVGFGSKLIAFIQRTAHAIKRTVEDKLAETISPLDYIPVALHAAIKDGTTNVDLTPYLTDMLDDYAPYGSGVSYAGLHVVFPKGRYKFNLDLTGRHGVTIRGSGRRATEWVAFADAPVFNDDDNATVTNDISIRNGTVRGFGNTATDGRGINLDRSYKPSLEKLFFFGCTKGVASRNVWEGVARDVYAAGGGADRCAIGWFQDEADDISGFRNNAWSISDSQFYDCLEHPIRIINPQGTTLNGVKTGGKPVLIGPDAGTVLVQWLHGSNNVFDSADGPGLILQKLAATTEGEIIFTGTWIGNAAQEGILLDGCTDVQFNGILGVTIGRELVKAVDSTRVSLLALTARQFNAANGGYPCVTLHNTTHSIVGPMTATSTYGGGSVVETGTSDFNKIIGVPSLPVLLGTSSNFSSASGAVSFEYRNAGDAVGALIPGTGDAYLGLGTIADRLLHSIKRTANGGMEVRTNGAARLRVGNGSGASEFLNTCYQPLNFPGSTLALAPASAAGTLWYITNGRKSGEGAGAGTGVMAYREASTWYRMSDGTAVVV